VTVTVTGSATKSRERVGEQEGARERGWVLTRKLSN
jgi:hypothetical protein